MGETLVTVELHEVEGGTELHLVHEGFPVEDARKGHEERLDGVSGALRGGRRLTHRTRAAPRR